MKDKTIKAIEQAISRTDDEISNKSSENCPLCKLFLTNKPLSNGLFIWDCSICPSDSLRDENFYFYKGMIIPYPTGCMNRSSFRDPYFDRKYWKERLPLLRKLNKKYFTKEGYNKKVFYEIMKEM